uniref:Putative secreted protein n=1 Tax=Amblyomma triste TaxID=251400 RepID=A0A023G1R1_AMBTT
MYLSFLSSVHFIGVTLLAATIHAENPHHQHQPHYRYWRTKHSSICFFVTLPWASKSIPNHRKLQNVTRKSTSQYLLLPDTLFFPWNSFATLCEYRQFFF